MANYIDCNEVMGIINDSNLFKSYNEYSSVFDAIDNLPVADVAPAIHAKWVEEYDFGGSSYYCSNCKEDALTKVETDYDYVCSKYCPHCGARMDKDN